MENVSSEVNEIIDNIANKLGTTAEFIVPELAKCMIAEQIIELIICGVLVLSAIIAIIALCKKKKLTDRYGDLTGAGGITLVISVAAGIVLFDLSYTAIKLAGYMASPTGAVVKEIIEEISKAN